MFRADLKRSWAAMKFAPVLMAATAALAAAQRLARVIAITHANARGLMTLIAFVLLLVTIGFYGAQRFWLNAAFQYQSFSLGEAASQTRRCFGRFVALGVVVTLCAIPAFIVAVVIDIASSVAARAVFILIAYAIDVILTFVVPALALTTTSVRRSFAISRRIVTQTGRASAWYLFAPGIALLGLAEVLPTNSALGGLSIALAMLTSLVALWFKGAILAFYLRVAHADGVDIQ